MQKLKSLFFFREIELTCYGECFAEKKLSINFRGKKNYFFCENIILPFQKHRHLVWMI